MREVVSGGRSRTGRWSAATASINEEFWSRVSLKSLDEAEVALQAWEQRYNRERFSMALKGRTPAERLGDFAIAA